MRDPKSNTPAAEPLLDSAAKRARVQAALDKFCSGQGTDRDYEVFRNRSLMVSSTAEQACHFLEASAKRTIPFDVYAIWANILRERWYQAQSSKRSTSRYSHELVEVPAND
jgi:hypothetical protein